MVIAIGADHGGYAYKEYIKKEFDGKYFFVDCGNFEEESGDDYTKFSFAVAEAIAEKKADLGIMICRTGVGAIIAMNKVKGVFAGLCETEKSVELARKKNNVNAIAFGADNISKDLAIDIVKKFVTTKFEGGRHLERVENIRKYEERSTGRQDKYSN